MLSRSDPLPPVEDDETLCRFVSDRKHINEERVHWRAFLARDEDEALSFTRRRDASEEEIRQFGEDFAQRGGKRLIGYGELLAAQIGTTGLTFDPKEELGNPNHVNAGPLPADREGKQLLAQRLFELNPRSVMVAG